jgi:hypothetical protein
VNMFMIPTGMMMGAKVTISEWWLRQKAFRSGKVQARGASLRQLRAP